MFDLPVVTILNNNLDFQAVETGLDAAAFEHLEGVRKRKVSVERGFEVFSLREGSWPYGY